MKRILGIVAYILGTATAAGGQAFTLGPATTCANNLFGHALVVAGGVNAISVTGTIQLNVLPGAALCSILWEAEGPIVGPAGMWINTSSFSGTASIPAGATISFRLETEHVNEPGVGVAVAVAGPFAGPLVAFGAGPVDGAPFPHALAPDGLRQFFGISIDPPAGGGAFLFDFPVFSSTAVPEPSALFLLASGLLVAIAFGLRGTPRFGRSG